MHIRMIDHIQTLVTRYKVIIFIINIVGQNSLSIKIIQYIRIFMNDATNTFLYKILICNLTIKSEIIRI